MNATTDRWENELPATSEPEPCFVGTSWRCVCCGEVKHIAPMRHICEDCFTLFWNQDN